ncbi:MAG: zinc ribbon domain-containing protein, partial [Planctomycetia bacterium]|nr:zinc ribbon domain-containing protein [Planctomycetia bacterium]
MPIYEYVCRDCGHQFEWLVRGEEKPSCPSCGRERLTKQLSVPAAHTGAA